MKKVGEGRNLGEREGAKEGRVKDKEGGK
jgi:hypothetical protein